MRPEVGRVGPRQRRANDVVEGVALPQPKSTVSEQQLHGSPTLRSTSENVLSTTISVHPKALRRSKRVLDLIGATLVLPLALLLTPLIALAIRIDSPGPILYRQQRIGLGGRLFTICKFRSMYVDAEERGAQWAQKHDPRVTRVGRLLRASRLDEIPQLWNVLKGDMSLVGPRPERPEFAQLLHQTHSEFLARHSVKPGLTGLAQVAHRYTTSLDDWSVKLHYDLKYIKSMCTALDLRILAQTVVVVLKLRGV